VCGYPAWWLCAAEGAKETTKDCGGAEVGVVWLVGAVEVVAAFAAVGVVVEVVAAARVVGCVVDVEAMC